MKKIILPYMAATICLLLSQPVFSQANSDTAALGLAGDNLDLYAVLTLFQKSKTIEGFEKSLNEEKSKINNLDLDLDKKVDFIKVVTKKKDSSYQFILQIAVSKTETQDVAVILLDKDKKGKVSMQIVGDEDLYGKDYVIEPKTTTESITANPGYKGEDPITVNVPATTTVVVETTPIVQYVYSPAYVPYYPPYYYGYYPPYFAAFTVMAVGIYRSNHYYGHYGYHGGHYGGGNTVIVNNRNNYNNYNSNRNRATTVSDNKARGKYGSGTGGNRPSASTRPSTGAGGANRPSTGGPSGSAGGANRPSTGGPSGSAGANRPSTGGPSASTRPSTSGPSASQGMSNRSSSGASSSSMGSGRTRSSSSGMSSGGGGMRGGGGGGGRRR